MSAFGTSSTNPADTYSDYTAGLRAKIDLFDAAGHGLAEAQAFTEAQAARARLAATCETTIARIRAVRAVVAASEDAVRAADVALSIERQRLADAKALLDAGKGQPVDVAQAARRIATARRASLRRPWLRQSADRSSAYDRSVRGQLLMTTTLIANNGCSSSKLVPDDQRQEPREHVRSVRCQVVCDLCDSAGV